MDMTVFETEEQLLEYIQSQGVAVVIWKPAESMERSPSTRKGSKTPSQVVTNKGNWLRHEIEADLVGMGFRRGQVGFNNIVMAVYLISQIEDGKQIRVTYDIYPKVAKYFGTSVSSVERTIRNAIESVWRRGDLDSLRCLYPYPCDNLSGRPTNAEFLINTSFQYR